MKKKQIGFFAGTKRMFHLYWQTLRTKQPTLVKQEHDGYSVELFTRFSQLDFLLDKVRSLENESEATRQKAIHSPGYTNNGYELIFQVQLYTESFYYFAHRAKKIIDSYPTLKKVKAPGLINVRNNLLEHPDSPDGTPTYSFASAGPNGPVIKGGRFVNEKKAYMDQGLYKNAEEFREAVNLILKEAIEKLSNFPVT